MPNKIKNHIKRIRVFLKDKEKKDWVTISKEVFLITILKKQFPLYYFGRFFYKKGAPAAHNFMNLKEYQNIIYSTKLDRPTTSNILNNKLTFALFCKHNALPTPRTICYNLYNSFSFNGEIHPIYEEGQFLEFCESIFKSENIDRVFLKACEAKGGKGILLLTKNNIIENYKEVWSLIKNSSYIFQEPIVQNDQINKIYPNSINTLRVETYLNKNGQVEILGGYMRFGIGNSFIDNVSSGGFMVPINYREGKLFDKGFTAMVNGSSFITKHPTTNYNFSGFEIPFFKEAIDLCKKFALHIPTRIIGWDVAITPTGPIIIEGNHDPAIIAGEFSYGGYKNNPLFKEILSEI